MVLYNQSDISSIELGFPEHCKFFAINFHHDFQPLHEDLLRTNWRGEHFCKKSSIRVKNVQIELESKFN